jgi:hypothetical protein
MIFASGMTDSAVFVVLGLSALMVIGLHCLLFRFIYTTIFAGLLAKVEKWSVGYWLSHLGLFCLSCIVLYSLLFLQYYLTGEGLFQ